MGIAELLHNHEQVVLFCQQLVILHVIDHLQVNLVLDRLNLLIFTIFVFQLLTHGALLSFAEVLVT